MRRIWFLFLSIPISFFHLVCVPADPEYRQKVLENVRDTGFISREFFQILVKVPLPAKDAGIKELRNQCRKIAETKRDEIAVSILLQEIRANEGIFRGSLPPDLTSSSPPALPGQISNTTSASSVPGSIAVSGTTNTMTSNQPANANPTSATTPLTPNTRMTEKDKEKKEKLLTQDILVYRGAFAWFLNSLFLFREDYTDTANCTFIYRNIQKDLYANVIARGFKPISKEEAPEVP